MRRSLTKRREKLPVTVAEKRCFRCQLVKQAEDFYRSGIQKDGLTKQCVSCCLRENDARQLRAQLKRAMALVIDAGFTLMWDGEEVDRPEKVPKKSGFDRDETRRLNDPVVPFLVTDEDQTYLARNR